jgi:hypothetical protein
MFLKRPKNKIILPDKKNLQMTYLHICFGDGNALLILGAYTQFTQKRVWKKIGHIFRSTCVKNYSIIFHGMCKKRFLKMTRRQEKGRTTCSSLFANT